MSNIVHFKSTKPEIDNSVFVADSARVIGNVIIKANCSIWFGAVIRADADIIEIGKGTNVQDNAVIHVDPGYPVHIGQDCIIGHLAIVHGAHLENNVLVGMHATIMNGAKIGEYSIIGAGALVTANTIIPPYSLVLGSPGKVVKQVDEKGKLAIEENAKVYRERARDYLGN